jgi:hypothetical protein
LLLAVFLQWLQHSALLTAPLFGLYRHVGVPLEHVRVLIRLPSSALPALAMNRPSAQDMQEIERMRAGQKRQHKK